MLMRCATFFECGFIRKGGCTEPLYMLWEVASDYVDFGGEPVTIAACRKLCKKTAECKSFVHGNDNNYCGLFHEDAIKRCKAVDEDLFTFNYLESCAPDA